MPAKLYRDSLARFMAPGLSTDSAFVIHSLPVMRFSGFTSANRPQKVTRGQGQDWPLASTVVAVMLIGGHLQTVIGMGERGSVPVARPPTGGRRAPGDSSTGRGSLPPRARSTVSGSLQLQILRPDWESRQPPLQQPPPGRGPVDQANLGPDPIGGDRTEMAAVGGKVRVVALHPPLPDLQDPTVRTELVGDPGDPL